MQEIYKERFENNHLMFFHDLWEYVDRKLESGGVTTVAHPQDHLNQMASEMREPDQPYYYMKRTNLVDEINHRSLALA